MPASQIHTADVQSWTPATDGALTQDIATALEAGKVLSLPRLAFRLRPDEKRFLDPRWSDGHAKNISYDAPAAAIKGAAGRDDELMALRELLARFHQQAIGLIESLLPAYTPHLRQARTSYRPLGVSNRQVSWRKDDSRLHIDAFPSRPNRGERILRVFANVNPQGEPRVWRVGEPFEDMSSRFWPRLTAPRPGSSLLLSALRITKSRRSAYDHYMLQLHDAMKADLDYQRDAPQETARFPADSVWLCFSDQASHAAMSGQYMFEQTLHLPLEGLHQPERSPLRILERLAGRALV